MTDRYALVDGDGQVVNLVLWDGGSDWSPPEGLSATLAAPEVDLGWRLQDGAWIQPEGV